MPHTLKKNQWDKEADVIVAGSGFAGLAAAIEAALRGCSVVVLEKMKGFGGNSTISDGGMAAAGSDMQAQAGWKLFVWMVSAFLFSSPPSVCPVQRGHA